MPTTMLPPPTSLLPNVSSDFSTGPFVVDYDFYDADRPQFCASGSTYREMETFETVGFALEVVCLVAFGVFGFCGNLVAIPVLLSQHIANLFNRCVCVFVGRGFQECLWRQGSSINKLFLRIRQFCELLLAQIAFL